MSHPLPSHPCYLNGRILPLNEAHVSVMDRGFIFGDGIYEVVPIYQGRLFRLNDHLARLERSLAAAHLPNPHKREDWRKLMLDLVGINTPVLGDEQLLYLQVTRGVAMRHHVIDPDLEPTVFMMCQAHQPPDAATRHQGISAVTARDLRWSRGTLKSISMLGNVLARELATAKDAQETIMLDDRHLTEGASSNVWVVQEGALLTPAPGEHVLAGVRLGLVRELCEAMDIPTLQRPIHEDELRQADEILLTSAGREILPVTRLDGEPVGHGSLRGKPGPIYARLHEAYQEAKRLDD